MAHVNCLTFGKCNEYSYIQPLFKSTILYLLYIKFNRVEFIFCTESFFFFYYSPTKHASRAAAAVIILLAIGRNFAANKIEYYNSPWRIRRISSRWIYKTAAIPII